MNNLAFGRLTVFHDKGYFHFLLLKLQSKIIY